MPQADPSEGSSTPTTLDSPTKPDGRHGWLIALTRT
jgi:hypothetical protein